MKTDSYLYKELGVGIRSIYSILSGTCISHPSYLRIINETGVKVVDNVRTIRETIKRSLTNHHED
jgi:Iap family predicted aminopeptidase